METPAGVGHRRRPQDQGRRRGTGRKPAHGKRSRRCRRAGRRGWRRSSSTPTRPPRPRGPSARNTAPRRPPARRRWPPRPRNWPPTPPSGRPPATGCARSSTSGGPSPGWTARPTTRCGSAIRRPARRSTGAAARISPSSTASGPVPGRPRRRCANAPRSCPTPPTGAATAAAFRDLLAEWKAAGRAAKDVDDALWHRFKAAQDTFFAARNAVTAERDAEFPANADAKEALLAEAEKIDTSDLDAARAALRTISDKWDAIGKVPRERQRRSGAAAARDREEDARRADAGRVDPRGAGARRPVPRPRRAIRAAGREGRGGGPHQGGRGGPGQRRAVAAVGRGRAPRRCGRARAARRRRRGPNRYARFSARRIRRRGASRLVQQRPWTDVRRRRGGAAPRRPVARRCGSTPPAPSGRSA